MSLSSAVERDNTHAGRDDRGASADKLRAFRADVIAGLSQPEKRLQSKYFYDARGSWLFDRICELPEYYPTRTELAIMRESAREMTGRIGPARVLVEYGSGSSVKTRLLLDHLHEPAGYAPVDVSREHLMKASAAIAADYPHVPVYPVCADFTRPFALPPEIDRAAPRVVYFPGSTLGNFTPPSDLALLRSIARVVGANGAALVGLDLDKAPAVLEAAYNDSQGVTAAFNRNLLARINRELDGDFDLDAFAHRAVYNRAQGRIEMYLDSVCDQRVEVAGEYFQFREGEHIHTEYSCKYTLDGFTQLAARAGFSVERAFVDERAYFAVVYLLPSGERS